MNYIKGFFKTDLQRTVEKIDKQLNGIVKSGAPIFFWYAKKPGFFKTAKTVVTNFLKEIVEGIIFAIIIILVFAAGIALTAQQTKPLRDFRLDLAANTPVKVEYFKVPRHEIDLGEQYISAEDRP